MNMHHTKSDVGPLHDIKVLTKQQLEDQYGIEFQIGSKQVWDPVENRMFNDMVEWATYVAEQDNTFGESFSKFTKGNWDDDY